MSAIRLIAGLGSLTAIAAFVLATKWIVGTYPQFGLGMCCGGLVMILLYYIAEKTGARAPHY